MNISLNASQSWDSKSAGRLTLPEILGAGTIVRRDNALSFRHSESTNGSELQRKWNCVIRIGTPIWRTYQNFDFTDCAEWAVGP